MLGLTSLGVFHTAIGVVAVAAAIAAFFRDREISPRNGLGKLYIFTTVITCLTGFGIFQHGGFGIAHVLGIVTLLTLAVAGVAGRFAHRGRTARAVEVTAYTGTFFFHLIPAITETTTRFPLGRPLIADRDGPLLQGIAGLLVLAWAATVYAQLRRFNRARLAANPPQSLSTSSPLSSPEI
jgi:uncharacterized membrane protein